MVRWNSSVKLLDWFVTEWQKLRKIVEEHPEYFNGPGESIAKTIRDLCIFQQIEDAKKCLQPVAEALDTIQGNNICIADGVDIWKTLLENYRSSEQREWLASAERYERSLPDVWFAANVLHPKYGGEKLTQSELQRAMNWIENNRPGEKHDFLTFIGGGKSKFLEEFKNFESVKLSNFVQAQVLLGNIPARLGQLIEEFIAMAPSSAGLERLFSSMGYVHSDIRNRLDPERVRKLAFCMRLLNKSSFSE